MTCAQYSAVQRLSRLADRGEGLVTVFADEKAIFSDFGRIPCDFRLDIRDFGKNVRSRETRKNQGNLEAAVKGNSHGGLAGMLSTPMKSWLL